MHVIDASGHLYTPAVRWLNPATMPVSVAVVGTLTVTWSGQGGVGSPLDVDVVVAHSDVSGRAGRRYWRRLSGSQLR